MAQLVVRGLDDELKTRLRRAAAAHGRSMEEEARQILHSALPAVVLPTTEQSHLGLSERIHTLFMDTEIPEEYFAAVDAVRREGTARPMAVEAMEPGA